MNKAEQSEDYVLKAGRHRIVRDPVYGYIRLDPVPDDKEINDFYQSRYYDLIRKGKRASDIRRLMSGGETADKEREWLRATLYDDILAVINNNLDAPGKLLDIGCGTGELIDFMKLNEWEAAGLELSAEAAAACRDKGLEIYSLSVGRFLKDYPRYSSSFSAVTILHVLEHLPDPAEFLNQVKELLADDGLVIIQVPNDFNKLQLAAQQSLQTEPWWIAVPDHICYFDFESLYAFCELLGFKIIYSQSSFPMELFLLMGENYLADPEAGSKCHGKRKIFEMSIPGDLRRGIYQALAGIGVGRDCLVFARTG